MLKNFFLFMIAFFLICISIFRGNFNITWFLCRYVVPQEHLHFLHFRSCKLEWHSVNCSSLYQRLAQDEDSLLRFADRVLSKLQRHPLEKLIPLSTSFDYTSKVRKDPRGRGKLFEKTLLFDT